MIIAEYVWIDADKNVRSKVKVVPVDIEDKMTYSYPKWNFDGSSTGQAPGHDSEVILNPVRVFDNPFFKTSSNAVFVLCECLDKTGKPIETNTRHAAKELFDQNPELKPWYGLEQEYVMYSHTGRILGWPEVGYPKAQGPYYCSVGASEAFGRDIVNEHMIACLQAGISISGTNAEVMPGQWEYQVGCVEGIDAGDQLMMSRYILKRVAEKYGVDISFHPKPMEGDWNGSGMHTNFSTAPMRDSPDGYERFILPVMRKLEQKHLFHILNYGEENDMRLTGKHETASMDTFSFGVADRGASIRIPRETFQNGRGYFEDRRPAANADPYVVTSLIFETCCL